MLLFLFNSGANSGAATAPTVEAGGPYSATKDVATALDATVVAGTDPTPTFLWTIVSGGTGTFSDNSIEDPTFTPDQSSGYVLKLTITPSDTGAVFDTCVLVNASAGDAMLMRRRRRAA